MIQHFSLPWLLLAHQFSHLFETKIYNLRVFGFSIEETKIGENLGENYGLLIRYVVFFHRWSVIKCESQIRRNHWSSWWSVWCELKVNKTAYSRNEKKKKKRSFPFSKFSYRLWKLEVVKSIVFIVYCHQGGRWVLSSTMLPLKKLVFHTWWWWWSDNDHEYDHPGME